MLLLCCLLTFINPYNYFLLQGANFRDLKGVKVGANNIVEWDPEIERVYLSSGKPLVWVQLRSSL